MTTKNETKDAHFKSPRKTFHKTIKWKTKTKKPMLGVSTCISITQFFFKKKDLILVSLERFKVANAVLFFWGEMNCQSGQKNRMQPTNVARARPPCLGV